MGIYINPGNNGFEKIGRGDYIDKTGLIELMNHRIGSSDSLVCISRPRRFGKSFAAKMLSAYYDCSCDSHGLFDDKEIARTHDYTSHLNQYNVICLDITGFISDMKRKKKPLDLIQNMIVETIQNELKSMDPALVKEKNLNDCIIQYVERHGGRQFIFIIDEWDAMIREAKEDEAAQQAYLNLLRDWFKNTNFTPRAIAAAYMTGILPIKKDGSQSAISDFEEYSMIKPRQFRKYVGFTEAEVRKLCRERCISFQSMKRWYDGYYFKDVGSVYNPNSVMKAIRNKDFDSYWTETSAAESLMDYISQDYNGLSKTIAELIGGIDVKINTTGFANDLKTFRGKDDVLTLLVHFGYLSYDSEKKTVQIPNEEIKLEFQRSIREVKHDATLKRLAQSEQLFLDTLQKKEDAVAAQIENVHAEETSPLHYNSEDTLRGVIKLAYYTYRDHYLQWEELPAGDGYADVVYIPRHDSDWPALVIELKWSKSAEGAISQILQKRYPDALKNLGCPVLLVGITYEKDSPSSGRKHSCKIIEYQIS